jgi:hypothetical protein
MDNRYIGIEQNGVWKILFLNTKFLIYDEIKNVDELERAKLSDLINNLVRLNFLRYTSTINQYEILTQDY